MEIWKDVDGYEGVYQVSNEGRVRSLKFGRVRLLKEGVKSTGYRFVILCENSIKKQMHIHQMVAKAFKSNPNGYTTVHHIDHNPGNNNVENLEWISGEAHREIHGIGDKNVYQYNLNGELVKEWESARSAERETGLSQGHICECCRGGYLNKRRGKWVNITQYKGYRWSYSPL